MAEDRVRWDALDERFRVRGEAYWGYLTSVTGNGRTRMRQVLDGREEGPVWEWSPVGKLVLQGVLHHPYGRVGPWHEWDETDRLVSETIYDALGNRIIDRRLDEVGNIAHEERYEPARLWRDPETGQERPAPWLWLCPDRGCSRCHRCASTTVDECRHCHPRVLAVTERE